MVPREDTIAVISTASYALFKDFPLRFNFQPLPSQPSGTYIMDSGSAYGTQGEYGWL